MLNIKMSTGGGSAFTLSLPGGKVALCFLSVKPLTLMCVWLSFQTKEALFAALKLTFYVNDKRLLHLMTIFRSVSASTRVLALCYKGVRKGGLGGLMLKKNLELDIFKNFITFARRLIVFTYFLLVNLST